MAAATIFLFFFFSIPMITNAADPYYEYLQLAIQNPQSTFTRSTLTSFTIHGLWPTNWTNPPTTGPPISIQGCYPPPPAPLFDSSRGLSQAIQTKLKKSWPNVIVKHNHNPNFNADVAFWNHEYTEHGSCTKLKFTPEEYFESTDFWLTETPLDDAFFEGNLGSGVPWPTNAFENAITAKFNVRPRLICQGQKLMEVIICLDKDATKRIDCVEPSNCNDFLMDNINIDDLPDALLVEILCRLPCNKLVFQCKCVSKRWFSLISAQSFVGRYLCIQQDLQKPIHLTTLVVFDRASDSLLTTPDHPVFKTKAATSNFTLGFLPCYQAEALPKMREGTCYPWTVLEEGSIIPPVVVGTYKDLVLCCATKYNQRDYYLCNPYTKEWAGLPPTPQVYHSVPVAFVCEPYYKCEQGSIILNAEYMLKVVRVVPNSSDPNFHVEIFYSETRQWRELAVLCSRPFSSFYSINSTGIDYNGMLYWWCCDGFMFELDLSMSTTSNYSSGDHNIAKCRFIELPEDLKVSGIPHLVVSQGRLLMYMYMYLDFDDEDLHSIKVWELKQVVKDNSIQDKFKWLVDRVSLTSEDIPLMRPRNGLHKFRVLAFHRNNEDMVYLKFSNEIVTCTLRGGRLETATHIRFTTILDFYYPFVLPWWPTPIPKL